MGFSGGFALLIIAWCRFWWLCAIALVWCVEFCGFCGFGAVRFVGWFATLVLRFGVVCRLRAGLRALLPGAGFGGGLL